MTCEIDLAELARLEKAATPGPWSVGDRYGQAGTHPPARPESEECAYCHCGPPTKVWIDPRGVEMHRHLLRDWAPDEHVIETDDGEVRVAGTLGYDHGGIARPEDARLIVAMRNALPALLARIAELEAKPTSP